MKYECSNPMCQCGQDIHCKNPVHKKETTMFKKYLRTNIAEMRPYVKGEDLDKISVSDVDSPQTDMGMVARNPKNHDDQWYVANQYFIDNFKEAG